MILIINLTDALVPPRRIDTMSPHWLDRVVEEVLNLETVFVFDWRKNGASRLIRIHPAEFDPARPVLGRLRRMLRAEGISVSRLRQGFAK